MSWFSRKKNDDGGSRFGKKSGRESTVQYLRAFMDSRTEVEAYFEPPTRLEQSAILLVAGDGEWTRRRVPDIKEALKLAKELGVPLYDVARHGYPRSMREWNRRNPGLASR